MRYLKGIWVSGDGGLGEIVSEGIEHTTDSDFSHVAAELEIDGVLTGVEATTTEDGIGVHKFDAGKYYPGASGIDRYEEHLVPIPDELYCQLEDKAKYMLNEGYSYGFPDGIAGLVADTVSVAAGNEVVEHFASLFHSRNCSGTWTELVRSVYPDFLAGRESRAVTPEPARVGTIELVSKLGY